MRNEKERQVSKLADQLIAQLHEMDLSPDYSVSVFMTAYMRVCLLFDIPPDVMKNELQSYLLVYNEYFLKSNGQEKT
jgi:hypothetical protein